MENERIKVKNNKCLKELIENYGFVRSKDFNGDLYFYNTKCKLAINNKLHIGCWNSVHWTGSYAEFNMLYDIIQARLVEKVAE